MVTDQEQPLALLLWGLLCADVCTQCDDHLVLTWDGIGTGTRVRVPMSGYLPDTQHPDFPAALTAMRTLRALPPATHANLNLKVTLQ